MKLSLIILTFNSSPYIPDLLSGIVDKYGKKIKEKEMEVIIADNNSSDSTEKEVKKFKDVIFTQNGGNLGFAAGNNKASEKATGEIILFMNPDAILGEGDLTDIIKEFNNEKTGVVGGEIKSWDGKKELSCGKFYTFLNILLLSLGLEEKLGVRFTPSKKTKVDFVSGGFLGIRRELFRKLGGFDENFFMYIEDQELCFRVSREGYDVIFSPFASIKHKGQGSSNRTFAVVNIYKGLLYFQKKHMGKISFISSKVVLAGKALFLIFLGEIINNKYLIETYGKALNAI